MQLLAVPNSEREAARTAIGSGIGLEGRVIFTSGKTFGKDTTVRKKHLRAPTGVFQKFPSDLHILQHYCKMF